MTEITWSLLIHMISFLVLFLIFRRVFFVPIERTLREREAKITTMLEEAEERREKSVELQARCSERLKATREEAAATVERAERDAQDRYNEILAQARREGDELLQQAKDRIEDERKRALEEFEREASSIAVLIAERVLERRLDTQETEWVTEALHGNMRK